MLIEIVLAHGFDPARLLSDDVVRDTHAKLMTHAETRAAGFAGLPEPPEGKLVRYVAAYGRDAKFLHHVLENNPNVLSMRSYEIK